MIWLFRRKPLLDQETSDWMFEHVQWLLAHHAHRSAFASTRLLPLSERHFPIDDLGGHGAAQRLLEHVKTYAFVDHLSVTLRVDPTSGRFDQGGAGHVPQPRMTAAGTYRFTGYNTEITYDPRLVERPAELIAVLAHEISHAVLDFGASQSAPSEADEMLTDLTAIFLGFGFYLMVFRYETRIASPEVAQAWATYFSDYMSLREICFATALFAVLKGADKATTLSHAGSVVGPDARAHLKRAFRDLEGESARIEALRETMAGLASRRSGSPAIRLVPDGG